MGNVFVSAYPHARKLDGGAAKYLMRSASNRALEHLKSRDARSFGFAHPSEIAAQLTPYDSYRSRMERSVVREAVAELPQRQRDALEIYLDGEETKRQRSRRTGIPYSTLRAREQKALRNLRKKLKNYR